MEVAVERYSWLCFEAVSVRAGACPARNDHPIRSSNPFDHHRHVVVVVVVVVVCDEGDQEDGVGHVQLLVDRVGKELSKCNGGRVGDENDQVEAQLSQVSILTIDLQDKRGKSFVEVLRRS